MTVTPEIIATIVTSVLIIIGCLGIIIPVLPGSITALIGLIIWAVVLQSVEGWVVLALGATLLLAGCSGGDDDPAPSASASSEPTASEPTAEPAGRLDGRPRNGGVLRADVG